MASMTYLVENHLLRTVRRYDVDVPLRHRLFTLAGASVPALALLVGGCVGLLTGLPGSPATARDTLLSLPVVAWALVVALGAPGRTLRTALDSPRGWELVAATSATPRDFVHGRHALLETVKAVSAGSVVLGVVVGMAVTAPTQSDAGGPALVAALAVALGVALRVAAVLAAPARRLAGLSPWLLRVTAVAAAGLCALAWVTRGRGSWPGVLALAAATLASLGVAALADSRLRTVEWADVSAAALRGRTLRHEAPALPLRRPTALLAVDGRRLLRSADSRLRPVANYVGLLLVIAVGALGYSLFGSPIALPPDLPRAELAAGLCAFAGYGANVAAASVLALDADRHAYTLWSLVPGAMRAVATVRAAVGSVVISVCGLAAVAAATALLDLRPRDIALALLAVATMAAFGPVVELAGSMRWPELDWADATEIGTSTGARYVLGFTVGIPVAAALALGRGVEGEPGTVALVAAAAFLPLVAAVVAATLMSPVTRAVARSAHA